MYIAANRKQNISLTNQIQILTLKHMANLNVQLTRYLCKRAFVQLRRSAQVSRVSNHISKSLLNTYEDRRRTKVCLLTNLVNKANKKVNTSKSMQLWCILLRQLISRFSLNFNTDGFSKERYIHVFEPVLLSCLVSLVVLCYSRFHFMYFQKEICQRKEENSEDSSP